MANDANITILDTGFIKADHLSNQVSTANRVNSGDAFIIKAKQVIPGGKLLGSVNPALSSLEEPDFNIGSLEAPQIKIQGVLNPDVSADVSQLYMLWRLTRTYGYKAVFYNVHRQASDAGAATTLERDKQLINMLANGHYDTTEAQGDIDIDDIIWDGLGFDTNQNLTDVNHIHVIFTSFVPKQVGGKRLLSWELTGSLIKPGP